MRVFLPYYDIERKDIQEVDGLDMRFRKQRSMPNGSNNGTNTDGGQDTNSDSAFSDDASSMLSSSESSTSSTSNGKVRMVSESMEAKIKYK